MSIEDLNAMVKRIESDVGYQVACWDVDITCEICDIMKKKKISHRKIREDLLYSKKEWHKILSGDFTYKDAIEIFWYLGYVMDWKITTKDKKTAKDNIKRR